MAEPDFWNDQEKAQKIINETNVLKAKYDNFKNLTDHVENLEVTLELLEMEADPDVQAEFEDELSQTAKLLRDYRLGLLLNGKYDANNAILEIHPGAGGTESQDWGSMLLRMYTRWAEQHQFKVQIEDYQAGEVAELVVLQYGWWAITPTDTYVRKKGFTASCGYRLSIQPAGGTPRLLR